MFVIDTGNVKQKFNQENLNFAQHGKELSEEQGVIQKTGKQDWMNSYIRSLVGYNPDVDDMLMIKPIDADATSPKKALPISELNQTEIKLLPKIKEQERIIITENLKVYLTKLGMKIAEGAKKMYE